MNTETDKEIPISALEPISALALQLELSIVERQLINLRRRIWDSPEVKQRGTVISGIQRVEVALQQAARTLDRQLGQAA